MSTYTKFHFDHTSTTAAEEAAMRRSVIAEAQAAGWVGVTAFVEWFDEAVSYMTVEGDAPKIEIAGEWVGLTLTDEPDTFTASTFRLRGTPPAWVDVPNEATADGGTVHAVFARDGETVVANLMGVAPGHSVYGRKTEWPHLPGWEFSECLNAVVAYYYGGRKFPPEGQSWWVPSIRWHDPAYGREGIEYMAFWRQPLGRCPNCFGDLAECGCC